MAIHLFSGRDEDYTLGRTFREVGGLKGRLLELDVLHNTPESDMSELGDGYALMMRLALDGWVQGMDRRTPVSREVDASSL